jgi:hypothetical protein
VVVVVVMDMIVALVVVDFALLETDIVDIGTAVGHAGMLVKKPEEEELKREGEEQE